MNVGDLSANVGEYNDMTLRLEAALTLLGVNTTNMTVSYNDHSTTITAPNINTIKLVKQVVNASKLHLILPTGTQFTDYTAQSGMAVCVYMFMHVCVCVCVCVCGGTLSHPHTRSDPIA